MRLTLIILMLFIVNKVFSQNDTTFVKQKKVIVIGKEDSQVFSYYLIDVKPLFNKAKNKEESEILFKDYIKKQIGEKSIDEKGEVYVNLVINEKGEIEECKIIKSSNEELNEYAVNIITNLPTWSPGFNKGKSVKVSYNTVIKFD